MPQEQLQKSCRTLKSDCLLFSSKSWFVNFLEQWYNDGKELIPCVRTRKGMAHKKCLVYETHSGSRFLLTIAGESGLNHNRWQGITARSIELLRGRKGQIIWGDCHAQTFYAIPTELVLSLWDSWHKEITVAGTTRLTVKIDGHEGVIHGGVGEAYRFCLADYEMKELE